jgi:predicted ATPase
VDKLIERERELAEVEGLLQRRGEVLLVEGAAGAGKTSLLRAACGRADALGYDVVDARGSELEAGFAFGVVRQLFERRVAAAQDPDALLDGPAVAARPLRLGQPPEASDHDTSFAVLHGLYWLAANLAARRPLLIAVDDAHWADEPSLRWLAYLAARLEGLALALLVAARPAQPGATEAAPAALRAAASTILRPALLSEGATGVLVRAALGERCSDEVAAAAWASTGGNPLYLTELLRAVRRTGRRARSRPERCSPADARRSRAWCSHAYRATIPPRCAWRRHSPCSATAASCARPRPSPVCRWRMR